MTNLFNTPKYDVGFDVSSRTGNLTDEDYEIVFEFKIDANKDNEILLFIDGTNETMRYSDVKKITNKEIRAELINAFEWIASEEEAIRVSFYEPCPDEEYDSRI